MTDVPNPPTRGEALRFWAQLGFLSFGGPAGQIALMHRELVERRRWVGEGRFLHALNYCMLLPGPEAQQLATYLGWLMHGRAMGIAAGLLFILPAWVLMALLGWLYMAQGQQPMVQAVLAGLKPAVVAIVALAAWRLGRRTLTHPLLVALAGGALAALALGLPFPAVVAVAALVGWLGPRWVPAAFAPAAGAHVARGAHGAPSSSAAPGSGPRAWLDDASPLPAHAQAGAAHSALVLALGLLLGLLPWLALVAWQGAAGLLPTLAGFFTQAALLTFGGAYAVLPFVAQGAVQQFGWITAGQMMDGLALGETTPGPLIIVLVFIGFLAGWQHGGGDPLALGLLAAGVVGYFTFLPSFVFILGGAPYVERTRHLPAVAAPLRAISAAVVGVILHLALFLAAHSLWPQGRVDVWACGLALAAALALGRWQRSVVEVIVAAAVLGALRGVWTG